MCAIAGVSLALGFASLYEAVPFGAALFAALAGGVISDSEARASAPQGRWRALEGLGLVLLVPSFFVAALWLLANAVIARDPLFFAFSPYSNHAQTQDIEGFVFDLAGDAFDTLAFVCERSAAFLIPIGFVLLVRLLDGRFLRVNTVSVLLLTASVPFGLIAPLVYAHASFGWLRFFVYVLFVAAGWGLYEVATSRRPRRAASLVLAGWALAFPATLLAMSNPSVGQEEHVVVEALVRREGARELGHNSQLAYMRPVGRYLEAGPLARGQRVLFDGAWPLLALARPSHVRTLLIHSADRQFRAMLKVPRRHRVSYLLVPRPGAGSDALARARPRLWAGEDPGFRLVKGFPATPEHWRLYEVERDLTRTTAARPPRGG